MKKPSFTFKSVMKTYFKIFAVFLAGAVIFGYVYLKDYQDNLSSDTALKVLHAIQNSDTATLDTMSSNFPVSLKDKALFDKYIADFGEQDLYFYEGTSKVDGQVVFIFVDNNLKMATLTLEKTGKKSMFGFQKYALVDLKFKALKTYTIENTTSFDLLVNGLPIADQIQEVVDLQHHAFKEADFGPLTVKTYTYADFMFIDSVTVVDHPEAEVLHNQTTNTYTVIARPDQALQDEITAFGKDVIKAHTRLLCIPYLSRTTFLNDYGYPNSDFVATVNKYDLTVRYPFISESFGTLETDNVIQYGPHEFSIDVKLSYTWTATWYGKTVTRTTNPAYTFFVTDINGTWQVTDIGLLTNN